MVCVMKGDMWRRRREGGVRYGIKRPGLCDLTGLHTNERYRVSVSSPYSPYIYPLFEQPPIHSTVSDFGLHTRSIPLSVCVLLFRYESLCLIWTIFIVPQLPLHLLFFGVEMLIIEAVATLSWVAFISGLSCLRWTSITSSLARIFTEGALYHLTIFRYR